MASRLVRQQMMNDGTIRMHHRRWQDDDILSHDSLINLFTHLHECDEVIVDGPIELSLVQENLPLTAGE